MCWAFALYFFFFFFFNDTATTEFYTLSLHDALPISRSRSSQQDRHHGRRTTLVFLPLTQNPAGLTRQWMQSGKVCGLRGPGMMRGRNARTARSSAAIRKGGPPAQDSATWPSGPAVLARVKRSVIF